MRRHSWNLRNITTQHTISHLSGVIKTKITNPPRTQPTPWHPQTYAPPSRLTFHPPPSNQPNNHTNSILTALHSLRPLNLRLGHPPIPPPPLRPAPHRLPLQQRHRRAQNHRPRILPLPHPRPHAPRARRLKPDIHRRDPHRASIPLRLSLTDQHPLHLAQQQRPPQQRLRLRLAAAPRRHRRNQ